MTSITEELLSWSENFLEKPSKDLGGWTVCPYAKAARLKNQVKIIELKDSNEFLYTVSKEARTIKEQNKKLIIVACDDLSIIADELACYIEALNYAFVYHDVSMPFHPEDNDDEVNLKEESIVKQADKPLYGPIQPYNELEEVETLHKKGYDEWIHYYRYCN